MTSKWRIYRKCIIASVESVTSIVKATVCLHNFIMNEELTIATDLKHYCPSSLIDREDPDGNIIDGDWRKDPMPNLPSVRRAGSNMYSKNANEIRNELASYFLFDGAVPFQWNKK